MIIAQQVQCPVQRELAELSELSVSELRALALGAVDGDHDLAQQTFSVREGISIGK
jgi:hypothetical protein